MSELRITRIVNQPRDLVFEVVADIERYPEFVPGFADARIERTDDRHVEVVQRVGVKGMKVSFRTRAEIVPPHRITIHSRDWPFERLHQEWTLEDLGDGRTRVTFHSRYTLVSRRVQALVGRFFDRILRQTIDAFERRIKMIAARRARRSA
jgi:coenzyme Q-binding protein COQ10